MARRRKNENIFDLLLLFPWWVTLAVGIGLWFYLRGQSMPTSPFVPKEFVTWFVLQFLKWGCLGASLVSGVTTLFRKLLFASAKDIEAIRAMSWREFETLVGEAYRRQGYNVEETGGGGADGGIDLILRGKDEKVIVQCKQWKTFKIGVRIVREMYGIMVSENADRVIIVASGTYTKDAIDFACNKPIELMDGKALVQLIRDVKAGPVVAVPGDSSSAPPLRTTSQPHVQSESTTTPTCPKCGAPMVLRTATKGVNAGNQFWGCSKYPVCKGIVTV